VPKEIVTVSLVVFNRIQDTGEGGLPAFFGGVNTLLSSDHVVRMHYSQPE
jgi:hypothetical protein